MRDPGARRPRGGAVAAMQDSMPQFVGKGEAPHRLGQPGAQEDEVFARFQIAQRPRMERGGEARHIQPDGLDQRIYRDTVVPPRPLMGVLLGKPAEQRIRRLLDTCCLVCHANP